MHAAKQAKMPEGKCLGIEKGGAKHHGASKQREELSHEGQHHKVNLETEDEQE